MKITYIFLYKMINMLKIFWSKLNNKQKNMARNSENNTLHYKDFTPAVRNWKNSIYVYNKKTLSLIPEASNIAIRLIKAYFNLYNKKLESKIRRKNKRLRNKVRKLSTHKIFVSDGEFKHTNDKVNITLYTYNRQKVNYLNKIKRRFIALLKKNKLKKRLILIRKKGLAIVKKEERKKNIILKALSKNNQSIYLKKYENVYFKKFIKRSFKRLKFYVYYKQLLYINQSKFTKTYLQGLTNLLKKIYKKNIQFNIIDLKHIYLNSDIMIQSLILKIRRNKNRLLRYTKSLGAKIKINKKPLNSKYKNLLDLDSLSFRNELNIKNTNDLLYKLFVQNNTKSKHLKNVVLDFIKYKSVSGWRIQAAGRLTKRYTAARALTKVRYNGNLENINSSTNGYPSVILRGKVRPNLQYTQLNSKSRIGSYGIKGWLSGI